MRELIVDKKYNEKKLNTFLLANFNGLTLNTIFKTLRKKDIKVNNIRVKDNITLHQGDIIKIFICDELLFKSKDIDLDIIYEDDNVLCINKPKNLEVLGEDSLTQFLEKKYDYIYPCHRLDRNTTGLVLFAKNQKALDILNQKFKDKEIEKHYRCIIYGIPKQKENTLTDYLFKDKKKSLVFISDQPKKGYQKIITSYKVIKSYPESNTSLLDVELHTGKTHQIRAHLAFINHPIIGDGKYGSNKINKEFNKKTQCLHSYSLTFKFTSDAQFLNYLNNKTIKKEQNFN